MPKLPVLETASIQARRLTPHEDASRVASFLAHRASGKMGNHQGYVYSFARAARRYFDENKKAKTAFIAWYEKQ